MFCKGCGFNGGKAIQHYLHRNMFPNREIERE